MLQRSSLGSKQASASCYCSKCLHRMQAWQACLKEKEWEPLFRNLDLVPELSPGGVTRAGWGPSLAGECRSMALGESGSRSRTSAWLIRPCSRA